MLPSLKKHRGVPIRLLYDRKEVLVSNEED